MNLMPAFCLSSYHDRTMDGSLSSAYFFKENCRGARGEERGGYQEAIGNISHLPIQFIDILDIPEECTDLFRPQQQLLCVYDLPQVILPSHT